MLFVVMFVVSFRTVILLSGNVIEVLLTGGTLLAGAAIWLFTKFRREGGILLIIVISESMKGCCPCLSTIVLEMFLELVIGVISDVEEGTKLLRWENGVMITGVLGGDTLSNKARRNEGGDKLFNFVNNTIKKWNISYSDANAWSNLMSMLLCSSFCICAIACNALADIPMSSSVGVRGSSGSMLDIVFSSSECMTDGVCCGFGKLGCAGGSSGIVILFGSWFSCLTETFSCLECYLRICLRFTFFVLFNVSVLFQSILYCRKPTIILIVQLCARL